MTSSPRQFHVAAGKVGEIRRGRSDDDDGRPVIDLVDRAIEPLGQDDDAERQCEKRQSGDMAQSQIACKEIAHICAENTRKAERGPVSRANRGQVNLLHGDRLLSDG